MFGFLSSMKSARSSRWLRQVSLPVIACLWLVPALADGIHVGDIELEIDAGKLVTHNGRVFESALATLIAGAPSVYRSTTPGFDSAAGLLVYDPEAESAEEIGFNVLGPLLFWDGTEMTEPQVGLDLWWGAQKVTATGASGISGFSLGGATAEDGSFHEHFIFEIVQTAPVGAYGVLLELTPAGASTFTKTDPFLVVFNRGLGSEAFESGVHEMVELTAVPEPSSIALAGLGALSMVGAAMRRRWRIRRSAA